jgi:hypothetical protein
MHGDGPPDRPDRPGPASAPGAWPSGTGPPPYEPPRVAWEEPFEPMAATSCGFSNPFEQNCIARPAS